MTAYDDRYYAGRMAGADASAAAVVPLVLDLVGPRSIVCVGCGTGSWLATFRRHGIDDILGIDGAYVPVEQLEFPAEHFLAHDLATPLALDRTFDLAVSLEVAEHLPEAAAGRFVATLVSLAPVVLFSAAIPGQGGTQHVNEAWQSSWARRFAAHGYVPVDAIRRRVWNDPTVRHWYSQNILIYASPDALEENARLAEERRRMGDGMLDLVHPASYLALGERTLSARVGRRLRRLGGTGNRDSKMDS